MSVRLGLHTSTAFHLIRTLVNLGFLSQSAETKKYSIGAHLFALAAGALDESALLALATPVLEMLSEETGEASHLAVRAHHEITVVARTEATGMLQLSGRAGATRPAHATAIGKLLFAFMQPEERERALASLNLRAFTPHTITDLDALRRELDEIARTGLAHDRREFDADVRCIAVPVRDFTGRCAGAIGISGPVWRLSDTVIEAHASVLRRCAETLSVQLGFRG
ncbi:IclR family transcriptional regulator [Breoghania sp. L-A4]|nr:IclR family transcriptional regulator [Breoghania sp. L-A4]